MLSPGAAVGIDDVGVGGGRVHREFALQALGVLDRVGDGNVGHGVFGLDARARRLRRRVLAAGRRFVGSLDGNGGRGIGIVFFSVGAAVGDRGGGFHGYALRIVGVENENDCSGERWWQFSSAMG